MKNIKFDKMYSAVQITYKTDEEVKTETFSRQTPKDSLFLLKKRNSLAPIEDSHILSIKGIIDDKQDEEGLARCQWITDTRINKKAAVKLLLKELI